MDNSIEMTFENSQINMLSEHFSFLKISNLVRQWHNGFEVKW